MRQISAALVGLSLFLFGSCSDDDPCSKGFIIGACGLDGECVECVTHDDCVDRGMSCGLDGACGYHIPCADDQDCPGEMVCSNGLCWPSCNNDEDCQEGKRCDGRACYSLRCTSEGTCPEGWEPIEGSLECRYSGVR